MGDKLPIHIFILIFIYFLVIAATNVLAEGLSDAVFPAGWPFVLIRNKIRNITKLNLQIVI